MMEKRVNLRNLDLRPGQDFINVVYFDQQTLVETSFLVASVGGFSLNFFLFIPYNAKTQCSPVLSQL